MIALNKLAANLAWPLALALSGLVLLLVTFVFVRRTYRYLYFRSLDRARAECGPVLEGLLTGSTGYGETLDCLWTLSHSGPHGCLEALLMADKNPSPERAAVLARLCEDLGLVAEWQRRLANEASNCGAQPGGITGRQRSFLQRLRPLSFVLRAEAAENLGTIRHRPSWRLLVQALGDSEPSVRLAAVRALGRVQEPEGFRALVERLESAAIEAVPKISIRSLKMALESFPLAQAAHLQSLLESPHRRVRFLAADLVSASIERETASRSGRDLARDHAPSEVADIAVTLSALTQREAAQRSGHDRSRLPPEVRGIFLTRLRVDGNPDVRARAADVIGRLEDERALPALSELLEDPEWFVRLHAVRALAHRELPTLEVLTRRLTDAHWRVREAAAQALCAQGGPGIGRLLEHFLSTEDRYSREQAAEQFERAGLISSNFLQVLADVERESVAAPRAETGPEGDSSTAVTALRNRIQSRKRELLLREFALHSGHKIQSFAPRPASASGGGQGGSWPAPSGVRE